MGQRRGFKLLAGIVMLALLLAGCSGGNDNKPDAGNNGGNGAKTEANAPANGGNAGDGGELEPVELIYYYPASKVERDTQMVEDEINKLVQPKINATVRLKPVDFGNYETKLNTIMTANESFDLAFSAHWTGNFYGNSRKGAFMEITDEMVKQYLPKTSEILPPDFWEAAKVDGKGYMIPSYQQAFYMEGFQVQKKLADKYGLDTSTIKSWLDWEPFLKQIKENEKDIMPVNTKVGGIYVYQNLVQLYGGNIVVSMDDPTKVLYGAELESRRSELERDRRWVQEGLIDPDPALDKTRGDDLKNGKYAVTATNAMLPMPTYTANGIEWVNIPLSKAYTSQDAITAAGTVVSRTSKNPERALMFVELLNTDPELYNLLCFGIEGKHYKKIDDTHIEQIKDGGYDPNTKWVHGNTFNAYFVQDEPDDMRDIIKKTNEEAKPLINSGFRFNEEKVKTEWANASAVDSDVGAILSSGTVDVDAYLKKYIDAQKKAGIDKVIAEAQAQWDEFLKAKGQEWIDMSYK